MYYTYNVSLFFIYNINNIYLYSAFFEVTQSTGSVHIIILIFDALNIGIYYFMQLLKVFQHYVINFITSVSTHTFMSKCSL